MSLKLLENPHKILTKAIFFTDIRSFEKTQLKMLVSTVDNKEKINLIFRKSHYENKIIVISIKMFTL